MADLEKNVNQPGISPVNSPYCVLLGECTLSYLGLIAFSSFWILGAMVSFRP